MSSDPLVVEVVRSGVVESVHLVDVAVVDDGGALVASAGDPEVPAAFRSSAKPIQARVALQAGWSPAGDRALAIACASHNGEAAHVETVRAVLAAAGVDEGSLRCPADVPAFAPAAIEARSKSPVYHNCSGKHAGMLAACVQNDWPLDTYREPDHPLQARVRDAMAAALGLTDPVPLVDGCGVPTFVAPLRSLASAFLAIDDGGPEQAAMRAHPFLVGGSERFDTDLMRAAPSVLSKAGAEGLTCISAGGVGIALKSRDGAHRYRGPAALLVLRVMGLVDEDVVDAIPLHAATPVLGGGEPVGAMRARDGLARP